MAATAQQEHPGDLMDEAAGLEREADQLLAEVDRLKELAKDHRARAAALRHKANRILHPETGVTVKRQTPKSDSLLAAAALAVEDMPGVFGEAAVASALKIGSVRAKELLRALEAAGKISAVPERGGYRSVDPEAARVRDAVVELGEFSDQSLAEHLGTTASAISWYLTDLRRRGIVDGPASAMFYVRTGRETVVTRRFRRTPAEQEVVDRDLVERGKAVEYTGKPMVENGGNRRRAGERKSRGGNVRRSKKM